MDSVTKFYSDISKYGDHSSHGGALLKKSKKPMMHIMPHECDSQSESDSEIIGGNLEG